MLLFIREHHKINDVLFCPDMATSHYAKEVTAAESVEFVPKKDNAPNVPQCRPIEKFWAICKARYSKLTRKPKTIEGFTSKWTKISQRLWENAHERDPKEGQISGAAWRETNPWYKKLIGNTLTFNCSKFCQILSTTLNFIGYFVPVPNDRRDTLF